MYVKKYSFELGEIFLTNVHASKPQDYPAVFKGQYYEILLLLCTGDPYYVLYTALLIS